jgi:hypothetical protein
MAFSSRSTEGRDDCLFQKNFADQRNTQFKKQTEQRVKHALLA